MILYELEHQFLPNFIFGKNNPDSVYNTLVSKFPSLCTDFIKSVSTDEFAFDRNGFTSKRLPSRYIRQGRNDDFSFVTLYKFLKLSFPFYKYPEYSSLYPQAYVVLCSCQGKKTYYYFTLESDFTVKDENNNEIYWLCRRKIDDFGNLLYENLGQIKLDEKMDDKIFHTFLDEIYEKRRQISMNSNTRFSFAPIDYGYESDLKAKKENYQKLNAQNESKCFVATATYQDAMHPDVVLLRDFRDKFLRKSVFGRIFIAFYYKVGPYLAYLPDHYLWIRNLSKKVLALIVAGIKNRFYK